MDRGILEAAAGALDERIRSVRQVGGGWDFDVYELNDRWIVRAPRREEAAAALEREVALLPALDEALPVAVPVIRHVLREPRPAVVYPRLVGCPLNTARAVGCDEAILGENLGRILAALHSFSTEKAREHGADVRDPGTDAASLAERCAADIFPLLRASERERARREFDRYLAEPVPTLALHHADLGPMHVLCRNRRITGVIDWTDARIGDPALDLWWLAAEPEGAFVAGLVRAYERGGLAIDRSMRRRARFWYFLGPWHEVLYGLGPGGASLIRSGLAGIRSRLP